MNWKLAGIAGSIVLAAAALHFFSVTLPHLRDPLPHPSGYAATGAGAKACDQVRWDWSVMERGTNQKPGLEDNLWVDHFAVDHHVIMSPDDFYRQLNDWCDQHPRNSLADAAYYVTHPKERSN